jgi:adenine-specific DNA-methyltransferase
MDYKDAHNQNIKITGYPTEKNPDLLKRIIKASSNAGDLILDCFSGSGTTLAAASLLNRHWIGIDNSREAIKTTLVRFAKGTEAMGDFVNGKTKPDNRLLFDFEPTLPPSSAHSPIMDFNLFSERSLSSSLQEPAKRPVNEPILTIAAG